MEDLIKIIYGENHGVDENIIGESENFIGIKLPKQYKQLLKITNGCEIGDWFIFPVKDPKNIKKTWDDLVYNNRNRPCQIPEKLIVFAHNGTGDYLCFKKYDENKIDDSIYYWNHETGNQEKVAEDLRQFIIENDD